MLITGMSIARQGPGEPTKEAAIKTDAVAILHTITQETRYQLLQLIVAHPKGAPSLKELTYMADVTNQATIHEHLNKLIDVGMVKKIEVDDQDTGYPRVFYRIPDNALEFLQNHGLLESITIVQESYQAVEKPDHIKHEEDAPRPTTPYVGDVHPEAVKQILRNLADSDEDAEEVVERLQNIEKEENNITDRIFRALRQG